MAKKQARCDSDDHKGDWWDHVAFDSEHRLVLCVESGARDAENVEAVVAGVKRRWRGRK